jgi:phage tail sheath gpL-like
MTTVSFPKTTVNIQSNSPSVSIYPHKVLFIGQKTSAGTATAGNLIEDIQDDNSWDTLFGKRSMLAGMLRAARAINKQTRFDAIALTDASGGGSAAATSSVVFSGTATAAGQLIFDVGSETNHRYTVDVAVGDTAAGIATKLETLADADDYAPFTAAVNSATVTFTVSHVGTVGNTFGIKYSGSIPGITITLNGFASGATPPTLTNLFNVIGEEQYQTIVWPSDYGLATVKNFLDARFNVTDKIQSGVAISSRVSSYADHLTELNTHNSRSLTVLCFNLVNTSTHKGLDQVELPYVHSAKHAAIRSLRLTEGTNITAYNASNNAALDNEGGPRQATKPYANTPIPLNPLPPVGKGFTSVQIAGLNAAGGSVIGANRPRTAVLMGEMVTTYKTDAAGNVDKTFKFLNSIDSSTIAREYIFNNIKNDLAQARLTTGDLIPNVSMHNAVSIKGLLVKYYEDLSTDQWCITQASDRAIQFFKDNLEVTVDADNGIVRAVMVVPLVTQLREFIATMKVDFSL